MKPTVSLGFALASCLCALPVRAIGAEIHVARVGATPDFVSLSAVSGMTQRLEVAGEHFMPATDVVLTGLLRLQAEPTEANQTAVAIGELELPTHGRHLLLLSPGSGGRIRTSVVAVDARTFPAGSVAFLNLTSRELRCSVDGKYIELKSGTFDRIQPADTSRVAVNHQLHLKVKQAWVLENSTTLMTGLGRRCLIVLTEEEPKGPIRRTLVVDFNPAKHLAPLPDRTASKQVKAEPPLPDPPAK